MIGALNGVLVAYLRLPAIIVTLGTGYILATAALLLEPYVTTKEHYGGMDVLANGNLGGIPVICVTCLLLVVLAEFIMRRTTYGRGLIAVGQNDRAAALAGFNVERVVVIAFTISGLLAGLTSVLLSARLHGAFLDMGTFYLIQSIGAVVIGGTVILGGNSTFVGTLFGSLLLVLVVTTMQVLSLSPGEQGIIEGILVTLILAAAR